ncbi:MAG TPA: thiaminase II [Acetobacteraceae bacterium]
MNLPFDRGLFGQLRHDAAGHWRDYVEHPFVRALEDGTLPSAAFRRYLTQDYLFLIQFARAYALAGYKSASVADLRAAAAGLGAIVDVEMKLHVAYCADWGLSEAEMEAEPEAMETIAYTRFVLDRGLAGDLLDLHVALAPCIIGYAEIGERLAAQADVAGHPYQAWVAAYAGPEYQAAALAAVYTLDRLAASRGSESRYAELAATFVTATRLEAAFWDIGWSLVKR